MKISSTSMKREYWYPRSTSLDMVANDGEDGEHFLDEDR